MPVVLPIMAGTVLTMVRDDLLSSAVASGLALVASMQATAPELKASLEEMDIEAMLKTVEAVVNEVENDFNNKLKEQPNTPVSPTPAPAPASAPASMTAKADAKLDAKSDAKKATTPTPTTTTAPKSGSGPGPASAPTSPPTATAKDKEDGWIDVSKDASKAVASSASAPASMSSPLTGVKEATAALASATVIPGAKAADAVHFTKRKKSSLLNRSGNSAVALAVDHIEETCVRMHSALLDLDAAAKAHGARYFAGLRNPGYDPILERLRALQTVMDKRVDMLLKVLSLKSLTSQHVSWQNSNGTAPASAAASAGLSITAMTPSSTSAPAPTK